MRSQRRLCALALCLALAAGCSTAEPPRVVPITNPPEFRPRGPLQVKTLPEALAAIVTVCTTDLELPPVEPFYVQLYRDTNSYATYTGRLAGARENAPEHKGALSLALPYENRLHINMASVRGQSWGALLRLLAHEYGHNIEYVVAASRTAPRWVSEGFAEWVGAKVMNGLGWESYASSLGRAERELSRYDLETPTLSQLETADAWTKISQQAKGRVATYDLAFFAVDKLIAKNGVSAMMDFFVYKDFKAAFGVSPDDFQRAVAKDLETAYNATAIVGKRFQAKAPQWKVGYQWRYALVAPGLKGAALVPNEVVREETFDGIPAYVLAMGNKEYPHEKDTLAVLATLSGGKVVIKNDPPSLTLDWPLEVGKRWENHYVIQDVEEKQSAKIDTEVVVGDFEVIRVPAGSFPAFRIETYASPGGELISDQWYAPAVKWFVKSKFYREDGVIEQSLAAFKLD
ncbi:MAG TPA: hypothetical protein VI231_03700 [Candidatus Binatia bacterium]